MTRKRTAILISGRGSNMSALIAAASDAGYPAEIALVGSNRPEAAGLQRAAEAGIPTAIVDHTIYGKDRTAFERALHDVLLQHRIQIICLAGFMRLLSPWFIAQWPNRILNIHPALLPSFKGLDTHRRAIEAGASEHGATVHFVVAEMDSGPVVAQGRVPLFPDDTETALAARVLAVEHRIYPLALKLVASDRVRVDDGRCIVCGAVSAEEATLLPRHPAH
ncbi:MAG: phosphoribosylglycinamide formyltransferase [Pseudorhodoplanes sp.]|uniref:phosphoribosylglycinamide formyltransferase n=1 Tax=Pseudorhodoplanes sp. TaxID=1934341 RepID=UPI003D09C66F